MGGIDEEASSFSNMIMFEKEEDSIGKEAFSSSYTIDEETSSSSYTIDKEASSSSYTILFEDEEASSSLNTFGCKEERRP